MKSKYLLSSHSDISRSKTIKTTAIIFLDKFSVFKVKLHLYLRGMDIEHNIFFNNKLNSQYNISGLLESYFIVNKAQVKTT